MYIKGFELVDWGRILKWHKIAVECNVFPIIKTLIYSIISPFYSRSFELEYTRRSNASILCVQEASRKSNRRTISRLADTILMDVLQFEPTKAAWHLKLGCYLMFHYIPNWRFELYKNKFSFHERNVCTIALVELWLLMRELENIDFRDYNLVVAFYDAEFFQGYIIEHARKYGCKTATLQHGQFTGFREKVFENSGVEFRCFKSDYFLCWNQMTIDEGLKHGIDIDKFVKVGILGYVGMPYQPCVAPKNNIFGVVIGHPAFEEENIGLIESANNLAKHANMYYYLKLHPNYNEDHFDRFVDKQYYRGNIKKGIPILEYANSVDMSIVGSSSVYIELVYLNHKVLRYSTAGIKDKFRDVKAGLVFSSPKDIVQTYNASSDFGKEIFEYLCYVRDVTSAYKYFFSNFPVVK